MTTNNEHPPLSADDVASDIICMHDPIPEVEDLSYAIVQIEAYAAQQTAAKDERIRELEAKLRGSDAAVKDLYGWHKNIIAERDALQAQVAMLVGRLKDMHFAWQNKDDEYPHSFEIEAEKNALDAINQTQPTAEAYKAELLKPWREVREELLRVYCRLLKTGDHDNWLGDISKALEATEGLTDD